MALGVGELDAGVDRPHARHAAQAPGGPGTRARRRGRADRSPRPPADSVDRPAEAVSGATLAARIVRLAERAASRRASPIGTAETLLAARGRRDDRHRASLRPRRGARGDAAAPPRGPRAVRRRPSRRCSSLRRPPPIASARARAPHARRPNSGGWRPRSRGAPRAAATDREQRDARDARGLRRRDAPAPRLRTDVAGRGARRARRWCAAPRAGGGSRQRRWQARRAAASSTCGGRCANRRAARTRRRRPGAAGATRRCGWCWSATSPARCAPTRAPSCSLRTRSTGATGRSSCSPSRRASRARRTCCAPRDSDALPRADRRDGQRTGTAAPASALRSRGCSREFGRRTLGSRTVVVLLTDGLERGDPAELRASARAPAAAPAAASCG